MNIIKDLSILKILGFVVIPAIILALPVNLFTKDQKLYVQNSIALPDGEQFPSREVVTENQSQNSLTLPENLTFGAPIFSVLLNTNYEKPAQKICVANEFTLSLPDFLGEIDVEEYQNTGIGDLRVDFQYIDSGEVFSIYTHMGETKCKTPEFSGTVTANLEVNNFSAYVTDDNQRLIFSLIDRKESHIMVKDDFSVLRYLSDFLASLLGCLVLLGSVVSIWPVIKKRG